MQFVRVCLVESLYLCLFPHLLIAHGELRRNIQGKRVVDLLLVLVELFFSSAHAVVPKMCAQSDPPLQKTPISTDFA